jgi:hypothetical protein
MKASFIFTFWIVNNVKCVEKEGKREGGEEMTNEKERQARRKKDRHTTSGISHVLIYHCGANIFVV